MYNLYVSFVVSKKFLFFRSSRFYGAFVSAQRIPASQNDLMGLATYLGKEIAKMKNNNNELIIVSIFQLGKTDVKSDSKKNAH
jgi:hypothetical protein